MKGVTLTFSFSDSTEALKFVEVLNKKLGKNAVLGEVKGNKVKVFIPFSDNYRRVVREVKLLYYELHSGLSYRPRRLEITTVLSASDLKVAIPIQALVEALKFRGYEARVEGGYLVTNAGFQYVTELAAKISKYYEEAVRQGLATPLRKLVVAAAASMDLSINDAVNLLSKIGLVDRSNNKFILKLSYEDAIKKLRNFIIRKNNSE